MRHFEACSSFLSNTDSLRKDKLSDNLYKIPSQCDGIFCEQGNVSYNQDNRPRLFQIREKKNYNFVHTI
jgi:hypothetical protein